MLLNCQLQNEVSKANFNIVKRIYNWPPFMKVVYGIQHVLYVVANSFFQSFKGHVADVLALCVNKVCTIPFGLDQGSRVVFCYK